MDGQQIIEVDGVPRWARAQEWDVIRAEGYGLKIRDGEVIPRIWNAVYLPNTDKEEIVGFGTMDECVDICKAHAVTVAERAVAEASARVQVLKDVGSAAVGGDQVPDVGTP